jgi:hypothetical protein
LILCKCGHEKKEHFKDRKGYANCMRQCDCKAFRDPSEADPLGPRPNHAYWCRCPRCLPHGLYNFVEDDAPSTVKTIPNPPSTIPMFP